MVTALGKSGTDAFFRQTGAFDERLTLKVGVEKQFLLLDEVAEIGKKRPVTLCPAAVCS